MPRASPGRTCGAVADCPTRLRSYPKGLRPSAHPSTAAPIMRQSAALPDSSGEGTTTAVCDPRPASMGVRLLHDARRQGDAKCATEHIEVVGCGLAPLVA